MLVAKKGWRLFFLSGAAVILLLGVAYGHRYLRYSGDDHGFLGSTGIALPSDVRAVAHESLVDDNFFHETHFWMLVGPVDSLRQLAGSFGLERSDDDARYALPDMLSLFGVSAGPEDTIEGYEGGPEGGRDRWLIILSDDRGAVFVY